MKKNEINEVVQQGCNTVLPLAMKKGLRVTLDFDPDLPRIRFDRDKIEQVVINILDNAIKFSQKSPIVVRTRCADNMIKVSIRDLGRGICKEDLPKIFNRFIQLEPKIGGTGLGLAISKDIIEAHKGKIWVESNKRGTIFHFVLPMEHTRNEKKSIDR